MLGHTPPPTVTLRSPNYDPPPVDDKPCQVQFPGGVVRSRVPGNSSAWECAPIIDAVSWKSRPHKSHIHCFDGLLKIHRPNCCKVVIAVFTIMCHLIYVQDNNMSQIITTTARFIIYWGWRYRHARGWAIFEELLPTVGDCRWSKVMISLRFKRPDYNCYG